MAEPIVDVKQLRKEYKSTVAVDGLDLTLGLPGTVHGFLGPNGSGKTTTIRCLLNLIRPTAGDVRVFGVDTTKGLHSVAHRIGAIVENPKMFPSFSGRKNLELLADIRSIPYSEIDRVLAVVGLSDRGGDKFEQYSLGMKQRLAIGGALLKDPDLLILDEPANGLDPAGIAEMRVLIRNIADGGKAVLVSSHQLAEIEAVCDEVTIISNGRLVSTGSLDTVREQAGAREGVIVTIDDAAAASAVLAQSGFSAELTAPDKIFVELPASEAARISKALADGGRYVRGLAPSTLSLEDAFLELTGQPKLATPPPPPPGGSPPPPPPSPASPGGAS